MLTKLKNIVNIDGKSIFVKYTKHTEKYRLAGKKAGIRFFNTFSNKKKV